MPIARPKLMFHYQLLFLTAFNFFANAANAQLVSQTPKKATRIIIIERGGGFAPTHHKFIITPDSIIAEFSEPTEDSSIKFRYTKAIDSSVFNDLLAPFHHLYLSQIKSSYEGPSSIDHDWSYGVIILKGESVKKRESLNTN